MDCSGGCVGRQPCTWVARRDSCRGEWVARTHDRVKGASASLNCQYRFGKNLVRQYKRTYPSRGCRWIISIEELGRSENPCTVTNCFSRICTHMKRGTLRLNSLVYLWVSSLAAVRLYSPTWDTRMCQALSNFQSSMSKRRSFGGHPWMRAPLS